MKKLEKKRILLVEDNVTSLAVLSTTLKRHGASVIQDAWNVETVDILEEQLPIDLILLDINLRRGVNGYDVFDQIKANPSLADIPVIAVTSLDPEIEIPRAQHKGFSGFISKPIRVAHFPDQILSVLEGTPVWVVSRER